MKYFWFLDFLKFSVIMKIQDYFLKLLPDILYQKI